LHVANGSLVVEGALVAGAATAASLQVAESITAGGSLALGGRLRAAYVEAAVFNVTGSINLAQSFEVRVAIMVASVRC
jgi:hypothetical protein